MYAKIHLGIQPIWFLANNKVYMITHCDFNYSIGYQFVILSDYADYADYTQVYRHAFMYEIMKN
jgi:hypothetical protein